MTYDEAIQYWFGRINYEHRTPRPNDLSLDRIRALLDLLKRPQDRFRILHVAGSKGKGSTSAMLASILGEAGYRVGLFTSPHLVSISERVRVDGRPISEDEIAMAMKDIATVSRSTRFARSPTDNATLDDSLTFFEIATALGYLHFARRRVDLAVVEVGMGGRFDSTNVCKPALSIITSISFDHTRQLGDTLPLIAYEKAGIIKPGRPAVSGVLSTEPREVIRTVCRQRKAPLSELGVDFAYQYFRSAHKESAEALGELEVQTRRRTWPRMRLALLGQHQAANAAVAVEAIERLREQGIFVPERAVSAGLAHVRWPGRFECLGRAPVVILDCAHNVASVEALLQALNDFYPKLPGARRVLVFAGSRDKDLSGMLALLGPAFDGVLLTRFYNNPRAVPGNELASMLPSSNSGSVEVIDTPNEAWRRALALATPRDLICVTGSVFLAGELRPIILHDLGAK